MNEYVEELKNHPVEGNEDPAGLFPGLHTKDLIIAYLLDAVDEAANETLVTWLCDNTDKVFEEQPEIDDLRAQLQENHLEVTQAIAAIKAKEEAETCPQQVLSVIPTVYNFAMVVPYFDYLNVNDVSPSLDDDCVGYMAWGWHPKSQSWRKLGAYDEEHEAREVALEHHKLIRESLDVCVDVRPHFYLVNEDPDEEG